VPDSDKRRHAVKLIDEMQNHRDANATSDQSDTTNEI
jgi:hypothetical protein